ncbi:phosphoethanolamine transferase [Granulosicoccus antarcticus]|uniref:Phosphoethanolamine transferase EptA n=1 Tax=Granulosicoccus antarcticus IMCC3135 TaxID=1192854 RepID=A0A2Z2NYX9_9GAMM|nr:phosphoethanolamine--lipid A transferase [Granulosicoccus antarcticus]ASJ72344.1 Phosphoethanolamine transferase EptA [Granulosicoccus antarcticus IMCC3135]
MNNTTAVYSGKLENPSANNNRGQKVWRLSLSAPQLIVLIVLWVCLVDNVALWSELYSRLSPIGASAIGYGLSLLALMVMLLVIPMLLLGQRYVLKPILVLLLIVSAMLAYFTRKLGVVYDMEMIRNITETVKDGNTQEGMELLSFSMVLFLIPTALVPAMFVLFTKVDYGSFWRDSTGRIGWAAAVVVVAVVMVMFNFKYITYFSRENADLEVYLTPFFPIKTTSQLIQRKQEASKFVFTELGDDALKPVTSAARKVGIMVVGETARRGNFSLNGYPRETNPELSQRNIINFDNVTSCGTSTAFSVPCMFSFLGQSEYTPEKAAQQSNVLDVLEKAGVKTVWVDSNSSCKGVCNRIENTNLLKNADVSNPLFVDGAWHDEVLLENVDQYLDSTQGDVLLVLHTMGSHGPAYYRRYPESFARFTPFCQSKAPQDCSSEEIVNAYDNTILYTDYILASLIDRLDARNDSSFLLYASDHGESLGENGIYLHGLPRFIAPAVQQEVPMLAWLSPELMRERNWSILPNGVTQVQLPLTHDNISTSLLGLYEISSSLYKPELNLFNDDFMGQDMNKVASDNWSDSERAQSYSPVVSQ